ncbi:hypothetical protein [Blochmannia endosymbiont of Polyrhachis (Hedomyrma) turneri]|nr:hypothetical protein [Blochmannia endosymbiont of Polyrhachis (Hedomyrma) turneri]
MECVLGSIVTHAASLFVINVFAMERCVDLLSFGTVQMIIMVFFIKML